MKTKQLVLSNTAQFQDQHGNVMSLSEKMLKSMVDSNPIVPIIFAIHLIPVGVASEFEIEKDGVHCVLSSDLPWVDPERMNFGLVATFNDDASTIVSIIATVKS